MNYQEPKKKKQRVTGQDYHHWTEEEDMFLALCLAHMLPVPKITQLFEQLYHETLREPQLRGRTQDVRKRTRLPVQ